MYSESRTAQEVTEVLGIEPTESHEKGAPTRAGLAGRPLKPQYLTYQRSVWIYHPDGSSGDTDDQTGFSSLRTLVDVFADHAPTRLPNSEGIATPSSGGRGIPTAARGAS
ncbi:DUF4279 domain-containing protein [Agromyces sp. ISL-38]|nr:DUF4279 domain-containing protein [Agromyces sp. ISL-38]MBT2516458.1 DUF4279 domain-containing protein [Streptomyces sp. ISL-90]